MSSGSNGGGSSPSDMDFIFSENPWPLIYVIFAYNTYMYIQDWKSVLVWSYIWKALNIIFIWIFQNTIFKSLFDSSSSSSDSISFGSSQSEASVQELLVGTLLYAVLGILLGSIHKYLFVLPPGYDTFIPLAFWVPSTSFNFNKISKMGDISASKKTPNLSLYSTIKDYSPPPPLSTINNDNNEFITNQFIKNEDIDILPSKTNIEQYTKNNNINNNDENDNNDELYYTTAQLYQYYGNIHAVSGGDNNNNDNEGGKNKAYEMMAKDKNNIDHKKAWGLWPIKIMFGYGDDQYWYFRREFWKRIFQAFILGTPTTILFTLNVTNKFRAGNIIFLFLTLTLIGSFYLWNRKEEIHGWRFNAYYRWWFFSDLFIIVFHFWNFISPAINVIIASAIMIVVSIFAIPYYKIQ